ncbi:TolC family protein [Pseudomonas monteilii]|uniref:TolC family protein n=1 Tax=Pseudomonas monteilii TaxID=76759 RepID=UPI003D0468D7
MVRRRPDLYQAERQLATATARIGVEMAELYPDVPLGASAGVAGRFGELGENRATHFALGLLISWNIAYSGARARVRTAQADSEAALANSEGVVLRALSEVESALTRDSTQLQRNADLQVARDTASSAAMDEERLCRAGQSPYLVSVDANRTLASAEAEDRAESSRSVSCPRWIAHGSPRQST